MEKYKSIEILEEKFGLPTKAKVTYEDETSKEISGEELWTVLYNFAQQEGYEGSYEFMKNSDKFIKKEEAPVKKEEGVEKTESAEETKAEESEAPVFVAGSSKNKKEKKEKEKKTSKKGIVLRVAAGIVSLMLAMGGGYVLIDYLKTKLSSDTNNKSKNPYVQMVNYPVDEKNNYTDRIEEIDAKDEEVREELVSVIKGNIKTEEELEEFLSNQEALSWTNVTNISNYINGKTLTGDTYYTEFQSVYNEDTVDYAAVQRFNELRNNITHAAYKDKNVETTKDAVTAFDEMFVKFVFGDKEFNYSKISKSYKWEDLSPYAQNTILAMGMGVLTIEHDFSVTVDGENYNRDLAVEEVYKLKQNVYDDLLKQQDFYKKNSR